MLQRLSCRWTMYSLVAGDSDVGGAANSGDAVGGLKEAGEAGGVTAAFLQPDPQHGHGAVGEGHGPLFAALAEATNVGAGVEVDVAAVEPGELGHPEPGLGGEREQGAVASSFPAAGVGRSSSASISVAVRKDTMALSKRFWGMASTRAMTSACSGWHRAA